MTRPLRSVTANASSKNFYAVVGVQKSELCNSRALSSNNRPAFCFINEKKNIVIFPNMSNSAKEYL